MIVDAHAHFQPRSATQPTAGAAELVAAMDARDVRVAVVSPIVGSVTQDNDALLAAAARHPSRLVGYVNLDLRDVPGALAELERRATSDVFRGVKLHPSNHSWFPFWRDCFPVYERIEALGLPVLWHTGTEPDSTPLQVAYVAEHFPGMPCILGHFGLPDLAEECFPAAEQADNVYIDTTVNCRLPLIAEWKRRYGAHRVLWGSDFPLYLMDYEFAKLNALELTHDERRLVEGGNAERLFGLTAIGPLDEVPG